VTWLAFIAAALVIAQAVAAVVFLTQGAWLAAGLLAVGCVALALVAARVLRRPVDPRPGYVERQREFY
jgi:membrane protein implicated in regulation of membrane protease activity